MSIFRVGRNARCCSPAFRTLGRYYASSAPAPAEPFIDAPETTTVTPKPKKPRKKKEPKVKVPRDTSSVLDNSDVRNFLAGIAGTETTLADLERHKPARYCMPENNYYDYLKEYEHTQNILANSFNIKQLRQFLRMYGFKTVCPNKHAYAAAIMEQAWHYPVLAQVIKNHRDTTEMVNQSFLLDRPQSFLLLGKDGGDLHELSRKYTLRMALSSNPLALKASGLRGNINGFGQYLAEFKQNIRDEVYDIPTNKTLEPTMLQRVSRLSGAFTETSGDGQIRVTYREEDPKSLLLAKRHATRVSCETSTNLGDLVAHVWNASPNAGLSKSTYSLYPFLNPQTSPSASLASAFRLRRVGEWFGFGAPDATPRSASFDSFSGDIVTLSDKHSRLRPILDGMRAFDGEKTITASLGHVLLSSQSPTRTSLSPPLKGTYSISHMFSWLRTNAVDRVFSPSIPSALVDQPSTRHRFLHRLVYHIVRQTPEDFLAPEPLKTINMEMVLQPGASDGVNAAEPLVHRLLAGTENTFDLMLPDRPVDMQMMVSNMSSLASDAWPAELASYVADLDAYLQDPTGELSQPEVTPLTLIYNDELYILRSSTTVRQQLPDVDSEYLTESHLDLESGRKSSECKVVCVNPSSTESWSRFVDTCDALSRDRVATVTGGTTVEPSSSDDSYPQVTVDHE